MDENKEVPSQETPAAPDQPTVTEEETDVAAEAAKEPVLREAEPAGEEETALDMGEPPVEEAPPEETLPQSSDEEQTSPVDVSEASATTEEPTQDSEQSPTVESVIEAILFATDEPLPESKLAGIVETTGKQVRECVESLNARYETHGNAFRIEQIAGGYQMLTQPIYNAWLKKMLRVRSDSKLSPAAMETLAIIAYKQPIIRADIEAIRGVAVGEVIRSLMYKGLVKIAGRAEILGRPMLYGTTKKFLEIFGLNSIKDLPKAEDLKNPDRG